MRHPTRRPAAAMILAGALCAATAAAAQTEHTVYQSLWLDPVGDTAIGSDAAPRRAVPTPALLSEPPGWTPGDAAAVVLGDWPGVEPARDRLVAALLAEGAAVLELDVHSRRGLSPDSAAAPPPMPEELLPDLFAGLRHLRRDAGAGEVVAIGFGIGGQAALLATGDAVAEAHLGADGPRFAALLALGPVGYGFAGGQAPAAAQAWPERVARLCRVVADQAVPPAQALAVQWDCHEALAHPAGRRRDGATVVQAVGRR